MSEVPNLTGSSFYSSSIPCKDQRQSNFELAFVPYKTGKKCLPPAPSGVTFKMHTWGTGKKSYLIDQIVEAGKQVLKLKGKSWPNES